MSKREKRSSPLVAARKSPKQVRSEQLVKDILEAAVRVLTQHGARRFTTVRVAEEAGVSVGSLYQYFPNKESLLYRLQTDEWADTLDLLDEILSDPKRAPLDRLRHAVLTFFRSEQEEAALRVALDDAGALFRHTPEAEAHQVRAKDRIVQFLDEALPRQKAKERAFAAELTMTTMGAIAEKITAQDCARAEVDRWARATAEMLCSYLVTLGAR